MKNNIVQEKSFLFSIRIIKTYQQICSQKKEYILSKQLLRCGTSIGANIEESIGGQSKADFIYKIRISYKESRETIYWIKLLKATDYLSEELSISLLQDAEAICRILAKILITSKSD